MGEERNGIQLGTGVLYLSDTMEPVAEIADIHEFEPETEYGQEQEIVCYDAISGMKTVVGTIAAHPRTFAQFRKMASGMGDLKGFPRYRAIFKYYKLHKNQQRFMSTLLDVIDPLPEGNRIGEVRVDITGLPCTDFYEWFHMMICALRSSYKNYEEYRANKLRRQNRSKNRVRRREH